MLRVSDIPRALNTTLSRPQPFMTFLRSHFFIRIIIDNSDDHKTVKGLNPGVISKVG